MCGGHTALFLTDQLSVATGIYGEIEKVISSRLLSDDFFVLDSRIERATSVGILRLLETISADDLTAATAGECLVDLRLRSVEIRLEARI